MICTADLRFWVNFSFEFQGTLTVLASLSEGRLADKLQSAALLSPIAYLSHMTTALGVAAAKAFVGEVSRQMIPSAISLSLQL